MPICVVIFIEIHSHFLPICTNGSSLIERLFARAASREDIMMPFFAMYPNFLKFIVTSCLLVVLSACGGGSDGGSGKSEEPSDPDSGASSAIVLDVAVVDDGGVAIPGAMVTFASDAPAEAADQQGKVAGESEPSDGTLRVAAAADGFLGQSRILAVPEGTERIRLTLSLGTIGEPLTLADAESGGSVTGALGTAVTVPGSALVDDSRVAASGEVETRLTPLDLDDVNSRQAFPGAFRGVDDAGTERLLGAVAIADFGFTDDGTPLMLAQGQTAEIRLPLTAAVNALGQPFTEGQTVPLWSLDQTSGLWRQEGTGEVVAEPNAPNALALQAEVTHFSWWLGAVVLEPAVLEVGMACADRSGPCGELETGGGQVTFRTGEDGRPWFEQLTFVPSLGGIGGQIAEDSAVETELPVLPLVVFGRDTLGAFGGTNPAAIESAGGAYPPQIPLLLNPLERTETLIELLPLHEIDGDWMGPRTAAPLTGYLKSSGETHEYTVPLRPNDTLRLEAVALDSLAGPGARLIVTDPLGQTLLDTLIDSGGPLVEEVPADMGGKHVVSLVGTVNERAGYDVDTTTVAGPRPIVAECRPYDPEFDSKGAGNNWQAPEDETQTEYTIPSSQRGGGIVTATLSSGDVRPRLIVCAEGSCSDGSIVGDTAIEGGAARVQFEARIGTSYTFFNRQFGNAPEDDYPVSHSLSIDFSPRVDCWEPNNTRMEARGIVLDDPIEAYMLAGFETNFATSSEFVDWYIVDMRHPGRLEVDVSQPAGGHLMRVAVETEAGDSVLMENSRQSVAGSPFIVTSTRTLDPAIYLIRIGVLLSDDAAVPGNDAVPDHWGQKYQATVTRRTP